MQAHREVLWCAVLVSQDFDPLIALSHAEEVALDVGLTLSGSGIRTHRNILYKSVTLYSTSDMWESLQLNCQ